MATYSSILASGIPWTEEPGGLQSMGLQRAGHDLATTQQHSMGKNGVSEGRFRFLACILIRHHLKLNITSFRKSSTFSCHKYQTASLTCGIYNTTEMNSSMKEQQTDGHRGQTCGCQWGREWGELGCEVGIRRCTLFHREWLNNWVPLCITGDCIQHPVITTMENTMKNNAYIYV